VARGDVVDALAGRDHQRFQRPQRRVVPGAVGQQGQRAVDALHALDVHRQRVQEDAGHRMAGDLGQVGVASSGGGCTGGPCMRPAPMISSRSAPRWMAGDSGAVCRIEPSPYQPACPSPSTRVGRKDERNGRRRQQVLLRDGRGHGDALLRTPRAPPAGPL
jgi:hypothetical protein